MTIAVLFAINFGSFSTDVSLENVDAESSLNKLDTETQVNFVIIMEDMALTVNTENPNDGITYFQVLNEDRTDVVYEAVGCGLSSCTYDVSQLTSGTYYVSVSTENSNNFGDYIILE